MSRGHPDVVLDVLITRHGPVMGATAGGALLAVEMGNLAPDDTDADGLLQLNRAQSMADVQQAAVELTSPVQNLLAADAGNIAFFTTGPRARFENPAMAPGRVDGADGQHDWTGFASGEALPHSIDPASGELINANNPTWEADFPVFMGRDRYGDWRARRIRALLAAPGPEHCRLRQNPDGRHQRLCAGNSAANAGTRLARRTIRHGRPWHCCETGRAKWRWMRRSLLIFNAWTREMVTQTLQKNGFDPDDAPGGRR